MLNVLDKRIQFCFWVGKRRNNARGTSLDLAVISIGLRLHLLEAAHELLNCRQMINTYKYITVWINLSISPYEDISLYRYSSICIYAGMHNLLAAFSRNSFVTSPALWDSPAFGAHEREFPKRRALIQIPTLI